MPVTVCASVDLDALECYHRIHALNVGVSDAARVAILRQALPRFGELFAKFGVKATFFTVGQDVRTDAEGAAILAALVNQGHEVASHSHTHPYNLVRLPREQIANELDRAHDALGTATGSSPLGFRAPGYEVNAAVIELLAERGYAYDSSVFPSIPYYAAKAAVMGAMKVLGRTSGSILGSPRVLAAPTQIYRPSVANPYARGHAPLLELPVSVTPWLRLPVIGTALITLPEFVRRRLVKAALGGDVFNLEMHGIDLCDADQDGVDPKLVAKQPDLRVSLARKCAALERSLAECAAVGARFVPLRQVAHERTASI
ncbi:MAG: polysaccharide deacetylase family protein [Deltaproteobacteria bacterium]|nr:polysaccharide deacetylase family protein [Deltaproteobacteria bacterium]